MSRRQTYPVDLWAQQYRDGMCPDAIAALHQMTTGQSVSDVSVRNRIKGAGVKMRKRGAPVGVTRRFDRDEARKLVADGFSYEAVGRRFHVTGSAIRIALRREAAAG